MKYWFKNIDDIVARRVKLGLTQTGFWSRVHVSQSTASRYEVGREIPEPVKVLLQIAYGSEKQVEAIVSSLRREHEEGDYRT